MTSDENANDKAASVAVTPRDILFECPACTKSLVVDEVAAGMTIECPQCHISVIVPPKHTPSVPPPGSTAAGRVAPAPTTPVVLSEPKKVLERLASVAQQLKEMQTQRTEINNRLAARINEINRDLVMMARLETSQQQLMSELTQLLSHVGDASQSSSASSPSKTTVLGSSVGHTRVKFGD